MSEQAGRDIDEMLSADALLDVNVRVWAEIASTTSRSTCT
jgi:hypothetical protein